MLVGDPEVKTIQVLSTGVTNSNDILNRLRRFSSWSKLLKEVTRVKRLKSKQKQSEHVTVEEHERAAEAMIKIVQQQASPMRLRQ